MLDLDELLRFAVDREASDLHIKVGSPPFIRVDGELEPTPYDSVTAQDTEAMARAIVPEKQRADLDEAREVDFALSVNGVGRFRVGLFRQRGSLGLALRRITPGIPALEDLGLPPVSAELTESDSGLVLVTGPARSGRTTTLAAMVDRINSSQRKHIITVEDPVEVLHRDNESIVNQREVGTDTESYGTGLRRALRQDPDVIVVGMIEDGETARAAITAAGAGQLVIGAMSTLTPAATVKTLVEYFPGHLEHHARTMISMSLRGIVGQRLLSRADGGGRALATEVLVATAPVIDAISRGDEEMKFDQIVAEGDYWGMQGLDDSLTSLFMAGLVDKRDAIANATNPGDLRIELERLQVGATTPAPSQDLAGVSEPTLLSDRMPA